MTVSDTAPTLEDRPLDSNTRQFLQEAEASKFDFHSLSVKAAGDEKLKRSINNAVMRQHIARQLRVLELAGDIKQHALDHLDYYLEQLTTNVQKNGGQVHFATNAAHARRIILDIASKTHATRVIKSKSMVSEEINLAQALEQAGMDVVE